MATVRIATVTTATVGGAQTDAGNLAYLHAAIEGARGDIERVPGSGRIRGVWIYGGSVYAFRDNAAATACIMHKATPYGWVAQTLGYEVAFTSGGTASIAEGDTITGATSAATATVGRVIVESGTWAAGDAAGRLILTAMSGSFRAENLNTSSLSNIATISGEASINALPPGGRYEFVTHNFYGASNMKRMYGCNGVGLAFEWDGSVFVPIITGMATDTPSHIAVHKNHLFLAFAGGSAQHSGTGDPYAWTPVLGAAELGIGEEITNFLSSVAGTMTIFGRNKVTVLYGDDSANWQLQVLSGEAGAVEWTAQAIGTPVYLDDKGIRSLTATQNYGDFTMGSMSEAVGPIFPYKRRNGVTAVASIVIKSKDQYRLFWSDGSALSIYIGRKHPEFLPQDYGFVVRCACVGEDANGQEAAFVGTDDGLVYQMDSGTSFDGDAIEAYIRLAYTHARMPRQEKRWHGCAVEMTSAPDTQIGITADFSYGDSDVPASQVASMSISGGGGSWDESFWDEFYWSASPEGVASAPIDGIGANIGIIVASESTYDLPHTLHGMTVYWSPRRLVR